MATTWEAAYRPYARVRLDDGASGSDGVHRSWVMLMPEGEFSHPEYGKLHFDRKKLSEFKRHFDDKVRKIDIAFDLDHDAHAATGWLERIAFGEEIGREPGLWGLTAWTPIGIKNLRDRIYRYFSPEFGDYSDEESGQVYHNVIIGGALTNRPFLKVMPAVALSEVSTTPWSSIDKTKLPDSCFLDAANRRLPVYEGAGTIGKDGKYSQRGKLNIHGLTAAKAAIHGAHTGTPMSGLPSGTAARIERLLARYGGGTKAASETSVDVWEDGRTMTRKSNTNTGGFTLEREEESKIFMGGKGTPKPAKDDADGDQQMYDDDSDSQGYDDDSSELDDDSAELDDDTAEMDDGSADADDSMDDGGSDDNAQDSNLSRKKGSRRASRRMSKKASESYDEGERVTLREQRLATQLSEMRAQMTEMQRHAYRANVEKILNGWDAGKYQFSESRIKNPDAVERTGYRVARVELSRPAREAIKDFLLSERAFRMSDTDRGTICRLFELAAKGAVDLSVRGSSFDQEERKTIRLGGRQASDPEEQEEALQQQVEAIALSEYRKPVNKLSHAELAEVQQKAADLIGYRGY